MINILIPLERELFCGEQVQYRADGVRADFCEKHDRGLRPPGGWPLVLQADGRGGWSN